jgi:UDP-N-acetylmuramate dehydrogenase
MASSNVPALLKDFADIARANEPLGPYTLLQIGGPAEAVVEPRDPTELTAVVKRCVEGRVSYRVLGSGGNVLVRDEGVRGVVLRLSAPPFTGVTVAANRLRAGCGAPLSAVIAAAAKNGLVGFESLVGLNGTVGGALRRNAGDRTADMGQLVHHVEVLDDRGQAQVRERDELDFGPCESNLDDPVLLSAEFELEQDAPPAVLRRLRKAWIQHKAGQPFSYQSAARLFRNPPGLSAAALIEQAGLVGTKVGGAQVNDRNADYVTAEPGTTARDVLRLIDLIRARVKEQFRIDLELALSIW